MQHIHRRESDALFNECTTVVLGKVGTNLKLIKIPQKPQIVRQTFALPNLQTCKFYSNSSKRFLIPTHTLEAFTGVTTTRGPQSV